MPPPRPVSFTPAPTTGTRSYFKESLQPIYSAWLVLPFLLVYEIGIILFRSDVINGGDAIVINLGAPIFHRLGVEGSLISLVCLVGAFVVWQIKCNGSWKIKPPVLVAMFFESLFYAVILFLMLGFFVQHFTRGAEIRSPRDKKVGQTFLSANLNHEENSRPPSTPLLEHSARLIPCAAGTRSAGTTLHDFVLYCGAGVFEELVFRALLLGLLMLVLTKLLHMEHAYAAAWAVFIGAVIFSAFHHIGHNGDKIVLNVFLQRLLAGLYFSALYFNRGFGIAAATHALYDILVGLNQLRG